MDEDTIEEVKVVVATHAKVIACLACLEGMKLENENARATGEDDVHTPEDFFKLEKSLKALSNVIA
jgi:hypothetical protein